MLNRFGVETTSLIALLGAAWLAVGLALQGTLSNVTTAVIILIFRPFKIGDTVKLGSEVYGFDSLGFLSAVPIFRTVPMLSCRIEKYGAKPAGGISIPFPQRDVHVYQQPAATPPAQN